MGHDASCARCDNCESARAVHYNDVEVSPQGQPDATASDDNGTCRPISAHSRWEREFVLFRGLCCSSACESGIGERCRDGLRSPLTLPMLGAFLVFWMCTVSNSSFIVGAASTLFPGPAKYAAWREFANQALQAYLTVHMLLTLPHRVLYAFRLWRWLPGDVISLRRNLTASAGRIQQLRDGISRASRGLRKARGDGWRASGEASGGSAGAGQVGCDEEAGGAAERRCFGCREGTRAAGGCPHDAAEGARAASACCRGPQRPQHEHGRGQEQSSGHGRGRAAQEEAQGEAWPVPVLRPHERAHMAVTVALLWLNAAAQLALFLYMVLRAPGERSWPAVGALLGAAVGALVAASAYATFSPLGKRLQVVPLGASPRAVQGRGTGSQRGGQAATLLREQSAGRSRPQLPMSAGLQEAHCWRGSAGEERCGGCSELPESAEVEQSGALTSTSAPLPAGACHVQAAVGQHRGPGSQSQSQGPAAGHQHTAASVAPLAADAEDSLPQSSSLLPLTEPILPSSAAAAALLQALHARPVHLPRYARRQHQVTSAQGHQKAGSLAVCSGSARFQSELQQQRQLQEEDRAELETKLSRSLSAESAAPRPGSAGGSVVPDSDACLIPTVPQKVALWCPPSSPGSKSAPGPAGGVLRPADADGALMGADLLDRPQWAGSVWQCCLDKPVAWEVALCCFCSHGRHVSGMGFGNAAAHSAQFFLFLCAPLAVCIPSARFISLPGPHWLLVALGVAAAVVGSVAYGGYFRWRMRRTFALPPAPFLCVGHKALADMLAWALCPCCALCQEVRTAQDYQLHTITVVPAEWGHEVERRTGEVQLHTVQLDTAIHPPIPAEAFSKC